MSAILEITGEVVVKTADDTVDTVWFPTGVIVEAADVFAMLFVDDSGGC